MTPIEKKNLEVQAKFQTAIKALIDLRDATESFGKIAGQADRAFAHAATTFTWSAGDSIQIHARQAVLAMKDLEKVCEPARNSREAA